MGARARHVELERQERRKEEARASAESGPVGEGESARGEGGVAAEGAQLDGAPILRGGRRRGEGHDDRREGNGATLHETLLGGWRERQSYPKRNAAHGPEGPARRVLLQGSA